MTIESIQEAGIDVDLIELRCLKPVGIETIIGKSLVRASKLAILDESTKTRGVSVSISVLPVLEEPFVDFSSTFLSIVFACTVVTQNKEKTNRSLDHLYALSILL